MDWFAYVDVVGLKDRNENLGHSAGDELLRGVVARFKANLRPYDLVVRLGADEFLCATSNTSESDVRQRFGKIAASFLPNPTHAGSGPGFAALRADETVAELIAWADGELSAAATPTIRPSRRRR